MSSESCQGARQQPYTTPRNPMQEPQNTPIFKESSHLICPKKGSKIGRGKTKKPSNIKVIRAKIAQQVKSRVLGVHLEPRAKKELQKWRGNALHGKVTRSILIRTILEKWVNCIFEMELQEVRTEGRILVRT